MHRADSCGRDNIFKCNGSFQGFLTISSPVENIASGKKSAVDFEEKELLAFEFSKSRERLCQVCVRTTGWGGNRNVAQSLCLRREGTRVRPGNIVGS